MHHQILITDLKRQRELLDQLITHLKGKERLNEADLHRYDATTKQIERRLKSLRKFISESVSGLSKSNQSKLNTNPGGISHEI